MKRSIRGTHLAVAFIVLAMAAAPAAEAHDWGCWIQATRTVQAWNNSTMKAEATAAINDWNNNTVLSVYDVGYHTTISVFDGYFGSTGWGGLASIESSSGCVITHGHARVNLSYNPSSNAAQGIFCQEVGHLFGLTHSNDGGCMGGGYYYDIGTYPGYSVVQHNIDDIAAKYANLGYSPTTSPAQPAAGAPVASAMWNYRPTSLQDAVANADAVVVATVTGVSAGPDLTMPVGKDDVDRIPTQRIAFGVQESFTGDLEDEFALFHTGNAKYILDEDGPYQAGQTYVLFLTHRKDGTYLVSSPEGRIAVTSKGLQPAAEDGFTTALKGQTLAKFSASLKKALRAQDEH